MNDVVKKMFGSCIAVKATGTYRPNPEKLIHPLEFPDCVSRQFCRGCGALYEIHPSLAQKLAGRCRTPVTAPFASGAFVTGGCVGCDGDKEQVEFVSLESLKC